MWYNVFNQKENTMKITAINPWGEPREYSSITSKNDNESQLVDFEYEVSNHILESITLRASEVDSENYLDVVKDVTRMSEDLRRCADGLSEVIKVSKEYGFSKVKLERKEEIKW